MKKIKLYIGETMLRIPKGVSISIDTQGKRPYISYEGLWYSYPSELTQLAIALAPKFKPK